MSISHNDVLAAFSEIMLLLDTTRCVMDAFGDTSRVFGFAPDEIRGMAWTDLLKVALPESADGLYWAVEAALEGYVKPEFLPARLPFLPDLTLDLRQPDAALVALRLHPALTDKLDTLLYRDLRLSLTSSAGFADVLLKGIGGPLTDIQIQDLTVILTDAQFALTLVEDWRNQWIMPSLVAPVPVHAQRLLKLDADDLPLRRLANQKLTIEYDVPPDVVVYSNGAIRTALIDLIRTLPQYVLKQSRIGINAQIVDDVIEVHVSYRAAENGMKAAQRITPVDLFERRTIKHSSRLRMMISSLHARLSPYGGSAWALPTETLSLATIVMTVPIWHGPTERPF